MNGAWNVQSNESKQGSQNVDLSEPGQRNLLARRIKEDIDKFCADKYDDGPRSHLGASLIGHPCSRYLWNTFRWIKHKKHSGRQQRLFNRGHREEERFVEWLRGIGFSVWEFSKALWYHPESDSYLIEDVDIQEKNNSIDIQHLINVSDEKHHIRQAELQGVKYDKGKVQHRVCAVNGHFGGSLDGIGELPTNYSINEKMLFEFKTQGTGTKFTNLQKNGVKKEKPQHYAQMSTYGRKYGFKYALYMAINKNDDDLHVEIVELDWTLGEQLELKAEMIICSQTPPDKLGMSAAYHECKWCDFLGVCHNDHAIDKNCRSCIKAKPVENAEWFCEMCQQVIPKEALQGSYQCWNPIC